MVDVIFPFGAVAHDGHVAFQHGPELRDLVEAYLAHELAEAGDARVVVAGELRSAVGLGVDAHAAELGHLERLAILTDAFLHIEHRSRRGEFHDEGGDEIYWGEHHQHKQRHHHVKQPFDDPLPDRHQLGADLHQRCTPDGRLPHVAEHQVLHHGDDLHLRLGQVHHREDDVHAILLGALDGDDHFLHFVFLNDVDDVVHRSEVRQELVQRPSWHVAHAHIAHKALARGFFLFGDLLVDGHGILEAAHDEGVEPDLAGLDVVFHDARDDQPAEVGQEELQSEEGDKRLIVSLIGHDLVVQDGCEEQHGDAQQGDEKGLRQFLHARLGVDALVGPRDAIEGHPSDGDDGQGEPEAVVVEGDAETLPYASVGHLVGLPEVVEERPGHRREDPVDKAVHVRQDAFLSHRSL